MKEQKETTTKVTVAEKDFNFLKKVIGLRDDILIRRTKMQEKGKKDEREVTTVLVADEYISYMVNTTQLTPAFTGEKFGMKNIKGFLKAVSTYGEMEERENDIVFSSAKKKITYKKLDESTIQPCKLPDVDTTGYVAIPFSRDEIKEVQEGLKNSDLSEYASLSITKDNNLMLKIGEMSYENIYEQEVKTVSRKETNEIKFLTKTAYLTRLFGTLDDDSKFTLYMKAGNPLIALEKNDITNTKTYIASVAGDDEENIDEVIDADGDEMEEDEE
jgi:hypothetical protein